MGNACGPTHMNAAAVDANGVGGQINDIDEAAL